MNHCRSAPLRVMAAIHNPHTTQKMTNRKQVVCRVVDHNYPKQHLDIETTPKSPMLIAYLSISLPEKSDMVKSSYPRLRWVCLTKNPPLESQETRRMRGQKDFVCLGCDCATQRVPSVPLMSAVFTPQRFPFQI